MTSLFYAIIQIGDNMTRKSGTEQTMREIKRELKPFTDFFDELDKAAKRAEREKQYKKQLQEEKYEKWERRLNWLSDKINKHKLLFYFDGV